MYGILESQKRRGEIHMFEFRVDDLEIVSSIVPAKMVFSHETMKEVTRAIISDFIEGVENNWYHNIELTYEQTTIGSMKLEGDAVDYALYAHELNLKDFLDEFVDYVDEYWEEYEKFEELIKEGNFKLTA